MPVVGTVVGDGISEGRLMRPTRVTTDMVVKFDVFEGEVSYTFGLLLGCCK